LLKIWHIDQSGLKGYCFFMPVLIILLLAIVWPATAHAVSDCSHELERGVASWYGPGFEGAMTQSEEIFDPQVMTAAHPDLPFGSIVKVTNMRNAQSVWVKINDRGAFGETRVIDLSEGAAAQIGMIDAGTAPVAIYACR
jgi:rare lipoprotein A